MADSSSRQGTGYASVEILQWLQRLHSPHDAALVAAFTADKLHGLPAIQVGPLEGRLLHLLTRLVRARAAVEIGTLAGYSTIHLASALEPDGILYSLEHEPKHVEVATENLRAAGLTQKVRVMQGPALQSLQKLHREGPFDLVFIDADKGNYDAYGRWAREHLREGGLLIGDNAFYFGNLLDSEDPAAAAMRRFHEEAREGFITTCIPTPDGMLLGIKK